MDEGDEHADLFAALMVTSLQLYEKEWDAIREEAGLMRVNGGGFTAHLGKPDGVSCKDYHSECSHWADKVCDRCFQMALMSLPCPCDPGTTPLTSQISHLTPHDNRIWQLEQ